MSTDSWKLEKDLCRCCHAEGSFLNLAEPCFVQGQPELIYSDMLRQCFDINISSVPGVLCAVTYTICEACVLRLRDASNFKQQVQLCEERFRDMYTRNVIQYHNPTFDVKVELPDADQDTGFKEESSVGEDDDDLFLSKLSNDDDDRPMIEIKIEDSKKGKAKAKPKPKARKSAAKKIGARKKKSAAPAPGKKQTAEEREALLQKVIEEPQLKRGGRFGPKFHLKEDDYKQEGDTYTCTHCEKRYDKIFSLRFHIKTKHYKIPRYVCSQCKKEFMTPAPLTVHKLEEHGIDERSKCKACNSVFNTKVQLRKHINNFHMLGEKYKCEFCEYESFSFEGMYKHKFKHKTVKDYHCRFCRKSFLRKATLDLHERIHTGDRRKVCSVCGQAFVQKASLNYHMTKYHPEVNF